MGLDVVGMLESFQVLLATGLSRREAKASIRLLLVCEVTDEMVDYAAKTSIEVVERC